MSPELTIALHKRGLYAYERPTGATLPASVKM